MKKKCVIFDIDGTLANLDHRLHHLEGIQIDCSCGGKPSYEDGLYSCEKCKDTGVIGKPDWVAFHKDCHLDKPIPEIVMLFKLLSQDYTIFYCTGRSESNRSVTEDWLINYVSEYSHELLMRPNKDFRSDFIIKKEMLDFIRIRHEVIMVFEDRDRNVKMYRDEGVVCLQVKEGAY